MKWFVVFLFILVVSCGYGGDVELNNEYYRSGTEGLFMEFIAKTPPDEVVEKEEFLIATEIHNRGAGVIKDGYLFLSTEEDLITVNDQNHNTFQLEARLRDNPYGGTEFFEFTAVAHPIALSSKQDSTITLLACYNYQTILEESICIDPRVRKNLVSLESCESEDLTFSDQGGPLAVTAVSVSPKLSSGGLKKMQFEITVEHKGDGFFSLPVPAESLCTTDDIDRDIFNRVQIGGKLAGVELDCRRGGIVRMENNIGQTTCDVPAEDREAAYTAPLYIELAYGYTERISHVVSIERVK